MAYAITAGHCLPGLGLARNWAQELEPELKPPSPPPTFFFLTEIPPPQALGGGWSPRQPDPSLALRASPEGSGGGFPSQAKLDIVTGASGLAAQRAEVPGEGRGALTLCSL